MNGKKYLGKHFFSILEKRFLPLYANFFFCILNLSWKMIPQTKPQMMKTMTTTSVQRRRRYRERMMMMMKRGHYLLTPMRRFPQQPEPNRWRSVWKSLLKKFCGTWGESLLLACWLWLVRFHFRFIHVYWSNAWLHTCQELSAEPITKVRRWNRIFRRNLTVK